jgi:hypothetical protein
LIKSKKINAAHDQVFLLFFFTNSSCQKVHEK